MPRAYFVSHAVYFDKTQDLLDKIFLGEFDPTKEVLLEGNAQAKSSGGSGKVLIKSYQDEKVVIDVNASDRGYLVLSDSWYPGWNAFIDGKKTEILRANYAYRAIYVDKGVHQVSFVYIPQSFEVGKILSLTGLVIFVVVVIFILIKKLNETRN